MLAVPLTSVPGSFVIALPTNSDTALIQQYRTIGKSFGALLLLLSAMGIWITITSALRPLKEVERTAAAVSAGDISQRLIHREGKTEVARINRALNSMLDSIEGAFGEREATLEQMRRFVADASHELRTPLASVRGYAELYRMGALSDKKDLADAMGRIESEAVRMGELVESLLVLARIDENKELTKSLTNLTKVVEDAAKNVSVASPKSKLEVVSLDGKKPSEIEALIDADSIRQVVINLISNATNFSPANKKITIAVGIDAGKKVIEVRDRGEGIPAQLREKIFERFYRVDNSRNRETGGSGLGLAICKSIVDRHHGSIKALETEGGGATLRVELP
jgi:two-component system OmpR family sensor kinase